MYYVYVGTPEGILHDVNSDDRVLINPKLEFELNKVPTFEFTMAPNHPCYNWDEVQGGDLGTDWLAPFSGTPLWVFQDDEVLFRGRVTDIQVDMNMNKTFYCEGEMGYLNDILLRPAEYHLEGESVARFLEAILDEHDDQVSQLSNEQAHGRHITVYFDVGMVTVKDSNDSLYRYTNYDTTMQTIKDDLVDDLGGYIRIRRELDDTYPFDIDRDCLVDYIYLDEYGNRNEQVIQFGENLLDFTSDKDRTDMFTCLIPLGALLDEDESEFSALETRLTIESVNGGSDYLILQDALETYGPVFKTVVWDDITEPSNLLTAAKNYLQEYEWDSMVIQATAVDMHLTDEQIMSFRLGDMVRVVSEPHGLDKWFPISQMTVYLDQPENNTVTLGTYDDVSLTARTNQVTSGLRNLEDFQVGNVIASAVAQATKIIDGATHGYVTINIDEDGRPFELLIMDTPDTGTAQKVWRWNMGGLGYSSTGYSGDDAAYGTAITMNGWILGDFIIANGMILADDRDVEFAKFDDSGMKIYAQSGRSDLMLMSIGREGLTLYDDSGATVLATFYSDGVKLYGSSTASERFESSSSRTLSANGQYNYTPYTGDYIVVSATVTVTASGRTEGTDYEVEVGTNSYGYYTVTVTNLTSSSYTVSISLAGYRRKVVDPYKLMQLDGYGMKVFDNNGSTRSSMDYDSFDIYDADENILMTLNRNGLRTYDADGTMRSSLDRTSFYVYDSSGSTNLALTTSGTSYYDSGTLVGIIGETYWHSAPNNKGLAFNLENSAAFMAFGWRETSSASLYTTQLAVHTTNSSETDGVHFGNKALLNGYALYFRADMNGYVSGAYGTGGAEGEYGAMFHGSYWFGDGGTLRYNEYEVATKNDIAGLSLLANGEEAEGDFSLYSGLQLDISELVNYKSSDETLKTSIQPISDARVDNITPVTFKWRDGDNTAHYGYIAQQVREHIPEIVKENDDGLLSLAYTEIIPLLHAKINTLEERIAKLEAVIYGKKESD